LHKHTQKSGREDIKLGRHIRRWEEIFKQNIKEWGGKVEMIFSGSGQESVMGYREHDN
jgi:hypothetical protein